MKRYLSSLLVLTLFLGNVSVFAMRNQTVEIPQAPGCTDQLRTCFSAIWKTCTKVLGMRQDEEANRTHLCDDVILHGILPYVKEVKALKTLRLVSKQWKEKVDKKLGIEFVHLKSFHNSLADDIDFKEIKKIERRLKKKITKSRQGTLSVVFVGVGKKFPKVNLNEGNVREELEKALLKRKVRVSEFVQGVIGGFRGAVDEGRGEASRAVSRELAFCNKVMCVEPDCMEYLTSESNADGLVTETPYWCTGCLLGGSVGALLGACGWFCCLYGATMSCGPMLVGGTLLEELLLLGMMSIVAAPTFAACGGLVVGIPCGFVSICGLGCLVSFLPVFCKSLFRSGVDFEQNKLVAMFFMTNDLGAETESEQLSSVFDESSDESFDEQQPLVELLIGDLDVETESEQMSRVSDESSDDGFDEQEPLLAPNK